MNQQPAYGMIESDGTNIYQTNQMGTKTTIGFTAEAYNQLMSIAEQYKAKLEDAGLIKKELTQEEQQAKQMELMEKMFTKIESYEKRLEGLEESLGGNEDGN